MALQTGAEEGEGDVVIAVGDYRQHDQARQDEAGVIHAAHGTELTAHHPTEDQQEQTGGHHGRQQALDPAAHEPPNLLAH